MPFETPGSQSYPDTFKPVLDDQFLKSLYSGINANEEMGVGQAESDAVRRGLVGTPFEATGVAGARQQGANARQGALSNFLYNLAGMKEQENILGEQQGFQAGQANLDRQFGAFELQKQMELGQQKIEAQKRGDLFGLYSGMAGPLGNLLGRGAANIPWSKLFAGMGALGGGSAAAGTAGGLDAGTTALETTAMLA